MPTTGSHPSPQVLSRVKMIRQEKKEYELEYKAKYDEYMKRKRDYDENLHKAYDEI